MMIQLNFADVVAEWRTVAKAHARLITIAVLSISGLNILWAHLDNQNPINGILSLAISVYGQYYVVGKMLDDGAPKKYAGKPRYGSLFVTCLAGSVGILVGTVLLVVPGIILASRWSVSTPFVVAEGLGGTAALRASWDSTGNSRQTVFLVQLTLWGVLAVLLLGIGILGVLANLNFHGRLTSLATAVVVSVGTVADWILGVAIYRCIKPSLVGLVDTFA